MTDRQILRNKVRSSQARESECAALRWAANQKEHTQAESNSYLLPCTEDERMTGGYCGSGPGIYLFSHGSAPPFSPAGQALHWP